jgi:hypothetical protein
MYGSPAPLVDEKNLITWSQNVTSIASLSGFKLNIGGMQINISQYDSYNVLFNVTMSINISDENAKMGIVKNISAPVSVSIENIEDPIFPLKTYGRVFRFIVVSNVSKMTTPIIGQNSSGSVSGKAFVKLNSQLQAGSYAGMILVTDSITGKESIADDFDGVVSEGNVVIPAGFPKPMISGVVNATTNVTNNTRIYLDQVTKGVWNLGNLTASLNNVNGNYYHFYQNSSSGASFLDRLEGRTTLSSRYQYGLETFVNLEELPVEFVKSTDSVLDYKYWSDIGGSAIRNGNYDSAFSWFKIDAATATEYGINTLL